MKFIIQQPVIPVYRTPFFRLILQKWGNEVLFVTGNKNKNKESFLIPEEIKDNTTLLTNCYFFGQRFMWQKKILFYTNDAQLVIVNFNIRHISTWLLLIKRKYRCLPTLVWGHAEGSNTHFKLFRKAMVNLSSGFIAYTETEANKVRLLYPNKPSFYLGNSCIHRDDCKSVYQETSVLNSFLYVGRLIKDKKVNQLIFAFCEYIKFSDVPSSFILNIVGDGDQKQNLQELADSLGIAERVVFHGKISDTSRLRSIYESAIASISPGYAGLSVIQSFAFGVPLILPHNFKHSPEVEACQENWNAFYFKSGDIKDFSKTLLKVYYNKETLVSRSSDISDKIREKYTFEGMAENFNQAISQFLN